MVLRVDEVARRETRYTCESPFSAIYKARDSATHYWYDQHKSILLCFAHPVAKTANDGGVTNCFQDYPVARIRQAAPLGAFLNRCRVERYSIPFLRRSVSG